MLSLDELIKHCEEVAYQNELLMKRYDDASGYNRSHNENIRIDGAKGCEQLIYLYRQLAKLLKDYKRLIAKEETTHFEGWENPNYNPEKDKRKILLWCAKCHEPVLDLFVYCPKCGRKFNSQEVQADEE